MLELRGFAPIGMLECWSSGIMGSGIMQCWINGPSTGGIDDKVKNPGPEDQVFDVRIKMVNILLKTNIPSFSPRRRRYPTSRRPPFHYSISGENSETPKILLYYQ
jgi:hypothetical protein